MFVNNLRGYRIIFTEVARKMLCRLTRENAEAIEKKLGALVAGAQNLDVKKLVAMKNPTYRLRVGNYRVVYVVREQEIIVEVIRIAHRKDVYLSEGF
jgi:mRNA interferase RelE/StbE